MRIDKFLNTVNIVKRRSLAEDMCKSGVVKINDRVAKPAKDVKVGDIIEIQYLEKTKKFQVLKIPTTKTIPKSAKDEYVKEI
ncbi:MAG: RNA-binding S4 domain-containing protein [Nautilia sp.]|nr:MAG: RNA-binding S4 domain-containing protein [Nautilia sp.]